MSVTPLPVGGAIMLPSGCVGNPACRAPAARGHPAGFDRFLKDGSLGGGEWLSLVRPKQAVTKKVTLQAAT
jgi:hypothetical protein